MDQRFVLFAGLAAEAAEPELAAVEAAAAEDAAATMLPPEAIPFAMSYKAGKMKSTGDFIVS